MPNKAEKKAEQKQLCGEKYVVVLPRLLLGMRGLGSLPHSVSSLILPYMMYKEVVAAVKGDMAVEAKKVI